MWKLHYEAPVGQRTNRDFRHVIVRGMWFDKIDKCWKDDLSDCLGNASSSDSSPNTTKAFQRYLRKHPEIQGREVVLVNKFIQYDNNGNWVSLDIKATYKG